MADLPLLQEGLEGDSFQTAGLAQHFVRILVPALSVAFGHLDNLQRLEVVSRLIRPA